MSPIFRREAFAAWNAHWIEERFGLDLERYGPHMARSVSQRLAGCPSESDAIAVVLETCCVGETSFFRHHEQLEAVVAHAGSLPSARDHRPVRAWSAGCSTGEEAYSLASALARASGRTPFVHATDVDSRKLAVAREARYTSWSLRGVEAWMHGGDLRIEDDEVSVAPAVRSAVRFVVHNLATQKYPVGFDLVVCRNVLLYFSDAMAARVIRRLEESLAPGGLLVLGVFDPEVPSSSLEHVDEVQRIYRRRTAVRPESRRAPAPVSREPSIERDAIGASRSGVFPGPSIEQRVSRLFAERAFDEALALLGDVAPQDRLEPVLHLFEARLALELGDDERALVAARRGHCLAPDDAAAEALYGLALSRSGRWERARRHLENALVRLDVVAPSDVDPILSPFDLTRMAHDELARNR